MSSRIKRWESPRSGPQRNVKGRGGQSRAKQLRKREKRLRQRLKRRD